MAPYTAVHIRVQPGKIHAVQRDRYRAVYAGVIVPAARNIVAYLCIARHTHYYVARHCGQRRLGICPQVAAYKVADSAARHGNAGAGHRHGLFCAVAAAVYSGSGRDAHIFGNTARYPGNIGIFAGGKAGYLRLLPALRRFRRNGNGRTIGKERIAAARGFRSALCKHGHCEQRRGKAKRKTYGQKLFHRFFLPEYSGLPAAHRQVYLPFILLSQSKMSS